MANSVLTNRTGQFWPLGFIKVPTAGTPVCIMSVVDANNTNAPGNQTNTLSDEYPWVVRGLAVNGWKPNANNNGLQVNSGNVYILAQGNGSQNRADYGVYIGVVVPGGSFFLPEGPTGMDLINPYGIFLDTDNNNDGAMVTAYAGVNP